VTGHLYRAVDKRGWTIDFYLSSMRNAKAAKRSLGKNLAGLKDWQTPSSLNTDKTVAFVVAIAELKAEGKCPPDLVHR
jgi:IS6 family transposase